MREYNINTRPKALDRQVVRRRGGSDAIDLIALVAVGIMVALALWGAGQ